VLMKEIGWWLALGLANLAAILDCGHFVIGGGLSIASTWCCPRRASISSTSSRVPGPSGDHRHPLDVRASLRRDGAALVAFERTS